MSSHKSCFLRMEHAWLEWEATALRWVAELERQLEFAHRESQDRAAKAMEARAVELLAVERATAAKRGLDAAKVYQAETEAVLQKSLAETNAALQESLEALESERKARSEVDQEVLVLWGRVLGTEESNGQLCEQVTWQEEGLSILQNTHLGMYQFHV